jgi:gamma-glutamylcyclotransferase (GGCT)/AIG2-like uncharacterized protein YtfP
VGNALSIEFLTSMTSDLADIIHVFVYGTLKSGECRERCWPYRPMKIQPATLRASLYDLGPFPAIVAGPDLMHGEVWELSPQHVQEALRVLDEVEGFARREGDLFIRKAVRCDSDDGRQIAAWAYFFARPETLRDAQRIKVGPNEVATWPQKTRPQKTRPQKAP